MFEKEAKHYANKWLEEVHELELKHKTDPKPEYIRIQQAYIDGAEPREKQIVELEKENAEAKEIIRELLNYDIILIDSTRKFEYMDLQKKAEAFLKE